MKTLKSSALGAAALASSLACAMPAFAAPETVATRTTTVSYADLDMATAGGAQTLYTRLKSATRMVCSVEKGFTTISTAMDRLRCVQSTLDKAVKDVNRPSLTALHSGGASTDLTAQR